MWHNPHLLLPTVLLQSQSLINISYLLGPQHQTRRTLLQRANGMDRQTPYRYIDPAPHTMQATLKTEKIYEHHKYNIKSNVDSLQVYETVTIKQHIFENQFMILLVIVFLGTKCNIVVPKVLLDGAT